MNNRLWIFILIWSIIYVVGCKEASTIQENTSLNQVSELRTDSIITNVDSLTDSIKIGVVPSYSFYNVALLVMDGTYNTEFIVPFNVFHHTKFRKGIKGMNVFTVSGEGRPICTFEGLEISVDYSILRDEIPPIDILVVPNAEIHATGDLDNRKLIDWVARTSVDALYTAAHGDGAFLLARAGILDSLISTTSPKSIDLYKRRFPNLKVAKGVYFVHDGKFITSQGGAKSLEAAMYLCDLIYGNDIARELADDLVMDWDLKQLKINKKCKIVPQTK